METLALAASMRQIIQERLFSQKIKMCGEELPSLTVSNLKLLTVHGRSVGGILYVLYFTKKCAQNKTENVKKYYNHYYFYLFCVHRLLLVPG